jgi:hypothetical protein
MMSMRDAISDCISGDAPGFAAQDAVWIEKRQMASATMLRAGVTRTVVDGV